MSERVYFGVSPSNFATPRQRFRLAFRDTLGLFGGIRDPRWSPRLQTFIEQLPGSTQLAFPFPPAASDDVQRVAVLDVQLMANVPALSVKTVMDRIAGVFPDTELIRVRLLEGAQSTAERAAGQAGELAAAVARDVELDAEQKGGGVVGWVKGAGMWVVVVLALVLGIVYLSRKGPAS